MTPRRLTTDQNAKAATRTPISIPRPASAGTSSPTLEASTVDTAAVANVPSIHSRTPERKPGIWAERRTDVRVRSAGQRHAASRVGDTQHDEAHGDRADQVGQRRGGAERAGDTRGKAEDAAADRDVDDRGGEAKGADDADERLVRPSGRTRGSGWCRHAA